MAFIFKKIDNLKNYVSNMSYEVETKPSDLDPEDWTDDEIEDAIAAENTEGGNVSSKLSSGIYFADDEKNKNYLADLGRKNSKNSRYNTVIGLDIPNNVVYFPFYLSISYPSNKIMDYNTYNAWNLIAKHEGYECRYGDYCAPTVLAFSLSACYTNVEDLGDTVKLEVASTNMIDYVFRTCTADGNLNPVILEDKSINIVDELKKWLDAVYDPDHWRYNLNRIGLDADQCIKNCKDTIKNINNFLYNSIKISVPLLFVTDPKQIAQNASESFSARSKVTEEKLRRADADLGLLQKMPYEEMPDFSTGDASEENDWDEFELEDEVAKEEGKDVATIHANRHQATKKASDIFDQKATWMRQQSEKYNLLIGFDDTYVYIPLYNCVTEYCLQEIGRLMPIKTGANMYMIGKDFGFKPLYGFDYTIPIIKCFNRKILFDRINNSDSEQVDVTFNISSQHTGLDFLNKYVYDNPNHKPVLAEDTSLDFEKIQQQYLSIMHRALDELNEHANTKFREYIEKYDILLMDINNNIDKFDDALELYKKSEKILIPMSLIKQGNSGVNQINWI